MDKDKDNKREEGEVMNGPYNTLSLYPYKPPTWIEQYITKIVVGGILTFVALSGTAAIQFVDLRAQVALMSSPTTTLPGSVSKEIYLQYAATMERRLSKIEEEIKINKDNAIKQNEIMSQINVTVQLNAKNAERVSKFLDNLNISKL
jgi:hypothetical protein